MTEVVKLTELMARAMLGDERYDALPVEILTYLQRKSLPDGEWASRAELHFDISRALSALDAAGYAMVPKLELNLMKATLSCVHRWAIEKKGNGSTAEERLSVIANHPGITGFPFLEQS